MDPIKMFAMLTGEDLTDIDLQPERIATGAQVNVGRISRLSDGLRGSPTARRDDRGSCEETLTPAPIPRDFSSGRSGMRVARHLVHASSRQLVRPCVGLGAHERLRV
jgi:hypothetical protein